MVTFLNHIILKNLWLDVVQNTLHLFCQDKRNAPFEYKHGHNIKRTIETVLHVVISYFSFAIRKNYRL